LGPVGKFFRWCFGRKLAKNERSVTATKMTDRFLSEGWEDGEATVEVEDHGIAEHIRDWVSQRCVGRNAKIRRRAVVRFSLRVKTLRTLVEDLKASVDVTASSTDLDFLKYRARALLDSKIKDKVDEYEDMKRAKNFYLNGLVTLYFVQTEDEVLFKDVLDRALSSIPDSSR